MAIPVFESVARYLLFIRDVNEYYADLMGRAAEESGLTKPEGDVLLFFANSPQLDTARDACEYRGFSKAYVSKAVEALSARHFLQAVTDGTDRRVQRVRVRPEAQAAVEVLRAAQQRFFDTLTGNVSEDEVKTLTQIMLRMRDNVHEATEG